MPSSDLTKMQIKREQGCHIDFVKWITATYGKKMEKITSNHIIIIVVN